jgi:CysZ protein
VTDGIAFVAGTPRLWGYAAVPLVVATLLTVALSWLGVAEAARATAGWTAAGAEHAGGALAVLGWVARAVLTIVAVLVAYLLAFTLAQPLSGWALDAIVRACEASHGLPARPRDPVLHAAARSLAVSVTSLLVGLPILAVLAIIGILVPPAVLVTVPLKLMVSALLVAWDLLDYPLGRRGLGVSARLDWFLAHRGAVLGFGSLAALVLFVPCAGLALLPVGVAGATILVVLCERRSAP